jgi:FtsZ-binding cell division protein ZapB
MSEHESDGKGGHEAQQQSDAGILSLSANDFQALEERIQRAVEVVRRERQARIAAEERAARAEANAGEQATQNEQLEKELSALHAERDHVRERVERLLGQLDALEL